MRINVYAIGTKMPAWVDDGVETYCKRLPRHVDLRFEGVPAAQRSAGITTDKIKAKEGDALLRRVRDADFVVALDEHGKGWTSARLAGQFEDWLNHYPTVALMIGGADGLDARCIERADRVWSLSPLTLPHALVRVVLAEQLYRAWTLTQGHPYHRE